MNADQSPLQGFSAPCTRAGFAQWSFAAIGELLERRQLSGYFLGKAVKSGIPPQDHSRLCVFRPTPFLFKWRLGRLFSWLALLPSPNPSAGMFGVLGGSAESCLCLEGRSGSPHARGLPWFSAFRNFSFGITPKPLPPLPVNFVLPTFDPLRVGGGFGPESFRVRYGKQHPSKLREAVLVVRQAHPKETLSLAARGSEAAQPCRAL